MLRKTSQLRTPTYSRRRTRFSIETLENRQLLAGEVFPNDPLFSTQWALHNTGQFGTRDADVDAPAAWSVTTGSMATVVAILDAGVDYTNPDLYLNIWLNPGEIPSSIRPSLTDTDSDGLITFRDLNSAVNADYVRDLNTNGYIDGGDLLANPTWENGRDDDANGRTDDLVGWDVADNDNDPQHVSDFAHGTDKSLIIGAMANNGLGGVGLNWSVQIIPVRIRSTSSGDLVNAHVVAGLDYAVASEAPISYQGWRGNPADAADMYSQEIYDAIDRARQAGQLIVTGAGNGSRNSDTRPWYPGAYDLDNVINAAALDENNRLSSLSNWGATSVDLGVPSYDGATSNSLAFTTGVAALLKSAHPEWTYAQIKDRILSTVDPLPSLAGKSVSGGRLNAANALGVERQLTLRASDDGQRLEVYPFNPPSPGEPPLDSWPMNAPSPYLLDTAMFDGDEAIFVELPAGAAGPTAGILLDTHSGTNRLHINSGRVLMDSVSTGGVLDTLVESGAELTTSRLKQNGLTLVTASRVTILAGGEKANILTALHLGASATLDLANNDLIVKTTAANKAALLNTLHSRLVSGFAGGAWNGAGLTSSAAKSNPDTTLSLVDNALLGYLQFSGEPVDANSLLLKYTYYGDIDQNGAVDADDLTVFANNFGRTSGATQVDGDVDFNGTVDADDLTVFANNFGKGAGAPLAAGAPAAVKDEGPRTKDEMGATVVISLPVESRSAELAAGLWVERREMEHASSRGARRLHSFGELASPSAAQPKRSFGVVGSQTEFGNQDRQGDQEEHDALVDLLARAIAVDSIAAGNDSLADERLATSRRMRLVDAMWAEEL